MLKIRLKRVGRINDPSYRVVVIPSTNGPKSGNVLEVVGNYNPRQSVKELNAERIKYWIGQGAQVSDTLHNLLITEKIIEGKKRNALPKKKPILKEVKEEVKEEVSSEVSVEAPAPAESPAETQAETPAE